MSENVSLSVVVQKTTHMLYGNLFTCKDISTYNM